MELDIIPGNLDYLPITPIFVDHGNNLDALDLLSRICALVPLPDFIWESLVESFREWLTYKWGLYPDFDVSDNFFEAMRLRLHYIFYSVNDRALVGRVQRRDLYVMFQPTSVVRAEVSPSRFEYFALLDWPSIQGSTVHLRAYTLDFDNEGVINPVSLRFEVPLDEELCVDHLPVVPCEFDGLSPFHFEPNCSDRINMQRHEVSH